MRLSEEDRPQYPVTRANTLGVLLFTTTLAMGSLLFATAGALSLLLLSNRVRTSHTWAAIATPLASIIGSGFLIVAPLLGNTVGRWAPVAMFGIVSIAWAIGSAIRYQISAAEPLVEAGTIPPWHNRLETASGAALAGAYVISVTFYLRLLAAFVLHGLEIHSDLVERGVTTTILVGIGGIGVWRGLSALEALEETAVAVKLSIIGALLAGLALFDLEGLFHHTLTLPPLVHDSPLHTLRVLAGLLLVVQGFETSRYLGDTYARKLRVRSMAMAQGITAVIYLVFIGLMLPLLIDGVAVVDDTAIISMTHRVHPALPMMLIVAAVMSQFSAAVADTIGSGGLLHQLVGKRLSPQLGYGLVASCAIALTWTANIFEVIAYASRGFALYYALQSISSAALAWHLGERNLAARFSAIALLCGACAIWAIPAG